ncbi:RND family transporter [Halioglobus maricola]|uniref:RND family transporter n=1 Tax=Halioglobus maricola TaxID=2601894 RepID=A0A5P9NLE5_9GAMM|nr:MMPL family transporter [Halioglobus maricola]QFU76572.1 RND family transporter [Halioglobus maricola]
MSEQRPHLHTYQFGEGEPILERLVFSYRPLWLVLFALGTVFFAYQTFNLRPDASFEKMIPMEHPFIKSFMKHRGDLGAAGTTIQVAVEHTRGDIFDAEYLDILQQINDEVFYLPGVDRNRMRSLWTPNVRWIEVTEQGFEGDKVIDARYDGSSEAMGRLRQNVLRSGEVGRLVSDDFQSSIVQAPLIDIDPASGQPLNYWDLSQRLEKDIREKYQQGTPGSEPQVRVYIIGFAKMVGDLLDGIVSIFMFAAIALVITALLLYWYTRSVRGTATVLLCAVVAVIWQLGLLTTLGYGLNAYSILIPFLVFAIGVSHGVQMMNAIMVEAAAGKNHFDAARGAFRVLYVPALIALISDAVGFTTMVLIPIEVIKDLGIAASVGVAVIILTNLFLLPILISYFGTGKRAVDNLEEKLADPNRRGVARRLASLASARVATLSIVVATLGFAVGIYGGQNLQIGDLDPGAPELHPDSRYNLDNKFITENYATSSDVMVIMAETEEQRCADYANVDMVDRFTWHMENVPGVNSSMSAVKISKLVASGYNEGSLKWATVSRNQRLLGTTFNSMPAVLMNTRCSLLPVALFLDDHKAETLQAVVDAAESFIAENRQDGISFALAAGNAGIEAATNQEIARARNRMMLLIYTAVCALVFISFASWRAVVCIVVPLALTSFLCEALMAHLGIGVKVATLPVIALGVGVGVDYGIYIYSKLSHYLRRGEGIEEAYYHTLRSTGAAVALTGAMLAVGVATWIFSPIKFQADMGMLLTFMFIWNMVGALWLLPALARFLIKTEN